MKAKQTSADWSLVMMSLTIVTGLVGLVFVAAAV